MQKRVKLKLLASLFTFISILLLWLVFFIADITQIHQDNIYYFPFVLTATLLVVGCGVVSIVLWVLFMDEPDGRIK